MGSGHIDLAGQEGGGSPFDPGLVYDAGFNDYLGFLCDVDPSVFANPARTCAALAGAGFPVKAVDLNYPSIGVSKVLGTTTVTRTVTNVSGGTRATTYRSRVKAPAGYTVTVTPSVLRLAPGASGSFTVTFTNGSAPVDAWRFGSLTWRGGAHDVYSPIAVKAAAISAPASVSGTGTDGSVDVPVSFGYTGAYTAGAHGLVPASVTSDTVAQDPDQTFDPADGFSDAVPIAVSGGALLRITLPPDGVADPNVDLDLYLADPTGAIVATSTLGGTDEQIDVPNPVDGSWTLYVHGWQTVSGSAAYTLYDWVVPATPGGGNLAITSAPTAATSGTSATVTAAWTGASAGWNLGAVSHTGPAGLLALTLVEVDNR
jgi:hypothetical protein